MSDRTLDIAFVHPDLGIGGAERLAVDAALALQSAGHRVSVFTTHHDPERCFEETRNGELDVTVFGDFLPRHIANRMLAPCTIARVGYLAARLASARPAGKPYDVIFCDLVAHAIPILRRACRSVIFYCHFPDLLLAPPGGPLRDLYRAPIDAWERRATAAADMVLVNSRYTAGRFEEALSLGATPAPGRFESRRSGSIATGKFPSLKAQPDGEVVFLSLNRFETPKNLALAIDSFALLLDRLEHSDRERCSLVIAGGYDDRLADNRAALAALRRSVDRYALADRVSFELSISEGRKLELLTKCRCLVYTPSAEHFGYGPIEAMASARPVIASNEGGPAETVIDSETGFLRPPRPDAFTDAMEMLVDDAERAREMGIAGQSARRENLLLRIVRGEVEPNRHGSGGSTCPLTKKIDLADEALGIETPPPARKLAA